MTLKQITYLRLERQKLIEPTDADGYEALFRLMSPVPTHFWIEPGTAPEIDYRCDFDDCHANDFARRMRSIVKGRFQGGNVGYVHLDELPLFAAAYKKPVKGYTEVEEVILTLLHNEGPMNLKLMKEITGILNKELSKAAQRLQKAFLLFEDQVDKENDRAWYLLEDEFQEMDFTRHSRMDACKEVVRRFVYLNVFVNGEMIKSYTKFTNKDIAACLHEMLSEGVIQQITVEGIKGFVLSEDLSDIEAVEGEIPDDLYLLDNNDYLVKSNELTLKKRFGKSDYKTLSYIYIRGEFVGRLLGYFRFGPNDLEDIELDVSDELKTAWKERILTAVRNAYDGQETSLKRYCGIDL